MRRHLFALLLSACAATAAVTPARDARADDAAITEAKARFNEGLELADSGNHQAALLKFQQAWAVFKSPAVLYNLARAEQLTGHDLDALSHFKQFLRAGTDPKITDAMRDKAKQNVDELSRKLGQIDIKTPQGARVTVDGKPVEPTVDTVAVQPGNHTVEATFDGKIKSISVDCTAGSTVTAKIEFESAPPNGDIEPPPPGGEEHHGFWTTGRTIGLGMGIVGLAGLGAGVYFWTNANGKSDDAANLRAKLPNPSSTCATSPGTPQCSQLKSLEDDYKSASTMRTAFMVGGGALLVGGAVLFIASSPGKHDEPSRGKVRFLPIANGREAGLTCLGTF